MNAIIAIVHLVQRFFKRTPSLIAQLQRKTPSMYKLYTGIKDETITDQKTAGTELFGHGKQDEFRKVKRRCIKYFVDLVFSLNIDDKADGKISAHFQLLKYLSCADLLRRFGFWKGAVELAETTVPTCTYYEFTELSIKAFDILKAKARNRKDIDFYRETCRQYRMYCSIHQVETEVKDTYREIQFIQNGALSPNPEITELVTRTLTKLIVYRKRFNTFFLHLMFWRFSWLSYNLGGQKEKVLDSCLEFESICDQRKHLVTDIRRAEIALVRACHYYYTGQNEQGVKAAISAMDVYPAETPNYILAAKMRFLHLMHLKKYLKALAVYDLVSPYLDAHKQPDQYKEWQIFAAYLRFALSGAAHAKLRKRLPPIPTQRRFENDKSGLALAVRALQISVLLTETDNPEIANIADDEIRRFQRYTRAHTDNSRLGAFCDILATLREAGFCLENLAAVWQEYYAFLRQSPAETGHYLGDAEIMPYDHVVEAIFNRLFGLEHHTGLRIQPTRKHRELRVISGTNKRANAGGAAQS